MSARRYRQAVAKMAQAARSPVGTMLTHDECAAVLAALRELTNSGRKPPRFAVETDPPGVFPVDGAMAPEGE